MVHAGFARRRIPAGDHRGANGLPSAACSLGLLDATVVNVGVIVGSAVFLTASDVAARCRRFASYWGTSCRSRRAAYLFVLGSDAVAASRW